MTVPPDSASQPAPSLSARLRQRIIDTGPITFRDWMQTALYDREGGYYCRTDLTHWGRKGDYRTSPERSKLFGASFARYFAQLYKQLDEPNEWLIVEAGAGAGEFARTALETLQSQYPAVFKATRYIVQEISPASSSLAAERLSDFHDCVQFAPVGRFPFYELGVIFSNELLDAFPVHRVRVENGELRELYITVDDGGTFSYVTGELSTPSLQTYFDLVGVELEEGRTAELNLEIANWFKQTVNQLGKGFIVTVDYGDEAENLYRSPDRREGTLRAFRKHNFQEVLSEPGDSDITSTIDWTYVRRIGAELGLQEVLFERQDRFLLRAGMVEQLEAMTQRSLNEGERASLRTSARDMILPTGMASSFQVLVQRKAEG